VVQGKEGGDVTWRMVVGGEECIVPCKCPIRADGRAHEQRRKVDKGRR